MWPLQQGLLIGDDHYLSSWWWHRAIYALQCNGDGDYNDDSDDDEDEDDDHLSIIDPNLGVAKPISVNVAQITNMTHLE